jgi:hypothetical protein
VKDPDQRGLCQHCGMWAFWDGRRWRHELSKLAACPNGRTSAAADLALIPREDA